MVHLLGLPSEVRHMILSYGATSEPLDLCHSAPVLKFISVYEGSPALAQVRIVHNWAQIRNPYLSLFLINRQIKHELRAVHPQELILGYHSWCCIREAFALNKVPNATHMLERVSRVDFVVPLSRLATREVVRLGSKKQQRNMVRKSLVTSIARVWWFAKLCEWDLVVMGEGEYEVRLSMTLKEALKDHKAQKIRLRRMRARRESENIVGGSESSRA